MSESIVTAILSLFGSLVGTLGGILASSRLTNYRLEQLEKKVAQHNNIINRTYALEARSEIFEERLSELFEKIEK